MVPAVQPQAGGEFGQPPLVFAGSLGGVGGQGRAAAGDGMAVAAQDLVDDTVTDRPVTAGGPEAVLVELRGDVVGVAALIGELQDALPELGVVAEVLEVLDGAADDAAGGGAAGPVQAYVDELAGAPDADGDLVEDRADDFLAFCVRDARA